VVIPGFVNIEHRQWVRAVRRQARQDLMETWGDTPEGRLDVEINGWRYVDIFDLRRLFGEEPYIEIIEEENWIQEEEEQEQEQEEERGVEEQEWIDRCFFYKSYRNILLLTHQFFSVAGAASL